MKGADANGERKGYKQPRRKERKAVRLAVSEAEEEEEV